MVTDKRWSGDYHTPGTTTSSNDKPRTRGARAAGMNRLRMRRRREYLLWGLAPPPRTAQVPVVYCQERFIFHFSFLISHLPLETEVLSMIRLTLDSFHSKRA